MAKPSDVRLALADPDWRDDLKKVETAMLADPVADLIVDASDCRSAGTLALQLLVAARRHAEVERRAFTIVNAGDALRAEVALAGLTEDVFGPDDATPDSETVAP